MTLSRFGIILSGRPILWSLCFQLTYRCNNRCRHCYVALPENDIDAKSKELETAEIKDMMKEAASLGCWNFIFTGGEPLLRSDFEELYVFSKKLGVKIQIFTNATLISPRLARLFKRMSPGREICVSIYGLAPATYDAVSRRAGSFGEAFRGVNLLLKHQIPFRVRGTILPQNRHEKDDFVRWARTLPWAQEGPVFFAGFLCASCGDHERNKRLKQLRLDPRSYVEVLRSGVNLPEHINGSRDYYLANLGVKGKKIFCCGAGFSAANIGPDGSLDPCLLACHSKVRYRLQKGSLEEAMKIFLPKIRKITAGNKEYVQKCASCFLRGVCHSCPGHAFLESGKLDQPVRYFCKVAHEEARFLGLIKGEEKAWKVRDWEKRINLVFNREASDGKAC